MGEASSTDKLRTKIWFTCKSRMNSEVRLRRYELAWHLLLCFLSIFIVGVTIFKKYLAAGFPIDEYLLLCSILILALSILVFSFKFGEKASQFRECYLKIQELLDNNDDYQKLATKYYAILNAYPNHSEADFYWLIVKQSVFSKAKLTDVNGQDLRATPTMFLVLLRNFAAFWLSIGLIMAVAASPLFWRLLCR